MLPLLVFNQKPALCLWSPWGALGRYRLANVTCLQKQMEKSMGASLALEVALASHVTSGAHHLRSLEWKGRRTQDAREV